MVEPLMTRDSTVTNENLAEEILYYLYDLSDRLDGPQPVTWSLSDRCEMARIHLHAEELYNRFATQRIKDDVNSFTSRTS